MFNHQSTGKMQMFIYQIHNKPIYFTISKNGYGKFEEKDGNITYINMNTGAFVSNHEVENEVFYSCPVCFTTFENGI